MNKASLNVTISEDGKVETHLEGNGMDCATLFSAATRIVMTAGMPEILARASFESGIDYAKRKSAPGATNTESGIHKLLHPDCSTTGCCVQVVKVNNPDDLRPLIDMMRGEQHGN